MNIVELLSKQIKSDALEAFFVSKPVNVSYLSGFTGHDSYLLITGKKNFFITDFRYYQQAKEEVKGFEIELVGANNYSPLHDLLAHLFEKNKLRRVGFEARHLTYAAVSKFKDRLKSTQFEPVYELVEKFRVIKSSSELKLIKRAASITAASFKNIEREIKAGRREYDIAVKLECDMRSRGAEGFAFETIVSSGARSALPHARPSQKTLKSGEPVMIDAGASLGGYNSDLTRVFLLGKIPHNIIKIYDIVAKAQDMALKAIKPGIKASKIDAVARDYIKKCGLGDCFGHSLGHGVGLEVHEAPSISDRSEVTLKEGMVFTVEPAIYLPGIGGVRIEDMVYLSDTRAEVITR